MLQNPGKQPPPVRGQGRRVTQDIILPRMHARERILDDGSLPIAGLNILLATWPDQE